MSRTSVKATKHLILRMISCVATYLFVCFLFVLFLSVLVNINSLFLKYLTTFSYVALFILALLCGFLNFLFTKNNIKLFLAYNLFEHLIVASVCISLSDFDFNLSNVLKFAVSLTVNLFTYVFLNIFSKSTGMKKHKKIPFK